MPHEAVTLREQVIPKSVLGTGHDMVVRIQHEAPSGPDGEIVEDKHARQDDACAAWMMAVLLREYPGYPWKTRHEGAQGIADFWIPILMGDNTRWRINLRTDPLTVDLLKRAAGTLLERYRLPRGRFELASFLDAREKHSKLILPSRLVPE